MIAATLDLDALNASIVDVKVALDEFVERLRSARFETHNEMMRRALFGEPASEPAMVDSSSDEKQVVCPNCGRLGLNSYTHWEKDQPLGGPPLYTCKRPQPAQPETANVECPNCHAGVKYKDDHLGPEGYLCPAPVLLVSGGADDATWDSMLQLFRLVANEQISARKALELAKDFYYRPTLQRMLANLEKIAADDIPAVMLGEPLTGSEPAQPEPVSAAFAIEGEDQDESEPLYLPGENASSTLPNRCRQWVQGPGCQPASEPAKVCGNCSEQVSSLSDHITCPETGEYYCHPTSEPAKMECPNCGEDTYPNRHDFPDGRYVCQRRVVAKVFAQEVCPNCAEQTPYSHKSHHDDHYTCEPCKPAQPEPVAEEMPEAVAIAADRLMGEGWDDSAEVVRSLWRAQAAEAGKVRLPKVRELLDHLDTEIGLSNKIDVLTQAALAELDAAEGRKP